MEVGCPKTYIVAAISTTANDAAERGLSDSNFGSESAWGLAFPSSGFLAVRLLPYNRTGTYIHAGRMYVELGRPCGVATGDGMGCPSCVCSHNKGMVEYAMRLLVPMGGRLDGDHMWEPTYNPT